MALWIPVERLACVLKRYGFTVTIMTPELLANGSSADDTHEIATRIAAKMQCGRDMPSFVAIERDGISRCYEIRGGQVSPKCYRRYVHKFGIHVKEFLSV
jgi:hypothetical protein